MMKRINKILLNTFLLLSLCFVNYSIKAADATIKNTWYYECIDKNVVGLDVRGKNSIEIAVEAPTSGLGSGTLYWRELLSDPNDILGFKFWDFRIYSPSGAEIYHMNPDEFGDGIVDAKNTWLTGGKAISGIIAGGLYKIVLTPYSYDANEAPLIPSDGMIYFQVFTKDGMACDIATPVTFGSITAVETNGQITLNWATETENNNDHFDVEVSKDGKFFKTVKTVASKAQDGNSGQKLYYSFILQQENVAMAFVGIACILLVSMVAFPGKPKSRILLLITIVSLLAAAACNKSITEAKLGDGEAGIKFIRVAQVDKDGTKTYSKVAKVVKE